MTSLPGIVTGQFGMPTGFPGTFICLPDTVTGLLSTLASHMSAVEGLVPGSRRGPMAAGGSDTRGPDTGLLGRADLGRADLGRADLGRADLGSVEPGVGGFGGGLGGAGARRCGVCCAGTRGAGVAAGIGCRDSSSGGIEQQDRATGIAGNTADFMRPGTSPGWTRLWVENWVEDWRTT
ncbi:hypothetical protein GCM10009556_103140 [Acrocarpospora pleiomorpha]